MDSANSLLRAMGQGAEDDLEKGTPLCPGVQVHRETEEIQEGRK